jgi:hypothetical protein
MPKINRTTVVVGAAGLAAGLMAYWLLGSKNAAQNRKTAKGWVRKAQTEIVRASKKLGKIDKATYMEMVDRVLQKYGKGVSVQELASIANQMKSAWSKISPSLSEVKKKKIRTLKRSAAK